MITIGSVRPKVGRRHWVAYALLAPYVIYALIFWVYPFIWGVRLSLQNWVLPGEAGASTFVILSPDAEPEDVGLENFAKIFSFYIGELPQRQDETTGELLFVCDRQTVLASEVADYEGPCTPRYESTRNVVPVSSYREWFQFDLLGKHYVVTAKLPLFWNALWVTFKFIILWLPMVIVGSLVLAMLLQRVKRFQGLFIAGYLSSYVVSGVAYSTVFKTLFARGGLVDEAAYHLLGTRVGWFSDPKIALFSIAMIVAWKYVGYYGLIFLSGLNAVPREVYEAAKLDGASVWHRFWRITIPLLNPSLVVVIVFGTILSFNIFTEPFLITGGTPYDSTNTFMLQIYRTTFEDLKIGLGSALAIVMSALSFATMTVIRRLVEREVAL